MPAIETIEILDVETCGSCGIKFAYPRWMMQRAMRDHARQFYCPNGHQLSYLGDDEAAKLRKELDRVKGSRDHWIAQADQLSAEVAEERKSHAATKGKLTRLKNRTANGTCTECNRTFRDLAAHMADKHGANDWAKHRH